MPTNTQATSIGDASDLGKNTCTPSGDWLVWQLADSAFPTGGFAHSGGIEAAWPHGYLRTPKQLKSFLVQVLYQTTQATVPFVTGVYDNPHRVLELDQTLDAMLTNHVANRASRLQGHALLATAEKVFVDCSLGELRQTVTAENTPGHVAVAFGFVTRQLHLERGKAVRLFLFLTLRGVLSAAVRLGIIGPLQGQKFQAEMEAEMEEAARVAEQIPPEEAAQTAPLIELLQSTQDRLYSRLFQS